MLGVEEVKQWSLSLKQEIEGGTFCHKSNKLGLMSKVLAIWSIHLVLEAMKVLAEVWQITEVTQADICGNANSSVAVKTACYLPRVLADMWYHPVDLLGVPIHVLESSDVMAWVITKVADSWYLECADLFSHQSLKLIFWS